MKNEIATEINSYPVHGLFLKILLFLKRAAKKNRRHHVLVIYVRGATGEGGSEN